MISSRRKLKLPHSSAVERLTVNQRVIGSNPIAAAIFLLLNFAGQFTFWTSYSKISHSAHYKKQNKSGFTLIELLVVIGIIAILLSFLFPVIQKARHQTYKTQCASNLRQMIVAWQMYANDHNDEACPMSIRDPDGSKTWYWDSFSDQNAKDDPKSSNNPYSLKRYIQSPISLRCPCFHQESSNAIRDKEQRSSIGYGYNATYIGADAWWGPGYTDLPSCHLAEIKDPSKTAVFADAEYWENKVKPFGLRVARWLRSPDEKILKESGKRSANNYSSGTVHFRHGHFANVAFADGHVKAVPDRKYMQPFPKEAPNCGALHPDDAKYNIDE